MNFASPLAWSLAFAYVAFSIVAMVVLMAAWWFLIEAVERLFARGVRVAANRDGQSKSHDPRPVTQPDPQLLKAAA